MDKKITPQTLKGFRDFLPKEAISRQYLISKINNVFERFGFDPLETPAIEYAQILLGKYGDEADKLLYLFEDRGKRKVGMRYDQTVPTARVVAQYQDIPKPFKRYQIQPVWRAENTQKGRYREFLQCDADIIGDNFAPTSDAEILTLFWTIYNELGFKEFKVVVNSRELLRFIIEETLNESFGQNKKPIQDQLFLDVTRILDKYSKIGETGIRDEFNKKGYSKPNIDMLIAKIKSIKLDLNSYKNLKEIDRNLFYSLQMAIENFKVPEDSIIIDPFMVRGLDYYTGLIFEGIDSDYQSSLGGGGRYDKLIGQFTGKDVNAVGFAIGFDRTLEAAKTLNLIPLNSTNTKILVTIIEDWKKVFPKALSLVTELRKANINTELYLNPQEKLDKQLKYADKKNIPYVIIIGPEEVASGKVVLKDMKTGEQKILTLQEVIKLLSSNR